MDKYVSIHLDPSSAKPLYLQICDGVADLIEKGKLPYGEKLPSIRQMASFLMSMPSQLSMRISSWKPKDMLKLASAAALMCLLPQM